MTPETKVKTAIRKILDAHEVYYFMPAANGYGRAGIPDIVCCINGHFVAIECKAGKGKTTALQYRELIAIHMAGGSSGVINETSLHTLPGIITAIKQRKTTWI